MSAFKNILVPTDFGEAAQRAEELACELASRFGATITLMHVWFVPTPAYAEAITLPLDQIERAAREKLDAEVKRVREKVTDVKSLLQPGVPWRSIVEAVEEHGFDLVVVGTHGRRGLPRFFLGSVAERVVRAAPVPVLTVHGDGKGKDD